MKTVKPYIFPLLLFTIAFIWRLSLISKGPYTTDCLLITSQGAKILDTGQMQYLHSHGYPLTALLAAFAIFVSRLFAISDQVFAINFASVLFNALSIIPFYFIVKKLFNKAAAFCSSIFLIISPIYLAISTFGNSHNPFMFFLFLGLWLILIYLENDRRIFLIFGSFILGLAGATRIQDLIIISITLSYFYLFGSDSNKTLKTKLKSFGILCLITITTTLSFYLPLLLNQQHFLNDTSSVGSTIGYFFVNPINGLFSPFLKVSFGFLLTNFSYYGFLMILLGFILLFMKRTKLGVFFLLWFLFPFFVFGNMDLTIPRFFTVAIIPLTMIQGFVLASMFRKSILLKLCTVIIFITLSIPTYLTLPSLIFRNERALLADFAKWVGQVTEPEAYIVANDEALYYQYYAKRKLLKRPAYFYSFEEASYLDFEHRLDALLDQNIPVYFTANGLFAYDYGQQFSSRIMSKYQGTIVGETWSEDWHRGIFTNTIFKGKLIKMSKKALPLPSQ